MTNEMRQRKDLENRAWLSNQGFDKNYLVCAGAGAGKTYTTVERAFNMLCDDSLGITPSDIVMITFTCKAATEMKDRLNNWIREKTEAETDGDRKLFLQGLLNSLPEMQISTIHSFCRKVLSAFPLQSGTGFAPEFDSEEESPSDSLADIFFDRAWKEGACSRSVNAGIKDVMVRSAFSFLNARPSLQPQFVDPDSPEGQDLWQKNMDSCRGILRNIRQSIDRADWSKLSRKLRTALLEGEDAGDDQVLAAAGLLISKGAEAQWWMGKSSKQPHKACEALKPFTKSYRVTDENIQQLAQIIRDVGKVSKEDRRNSFEAKIPCLPDEYRQAAEVAERLPEVEQLAELDESLNLMFHGIAVKDALILRDRFETYRRENHIVTLTDMLHMTADLVKNEEIRQRLHERYKVFFVDEYQDTDPIQTDIIFAITAEKYDPDWHKCEPAPGSLFLVGDAKQAIYRFRGTDIALWKEAEEVIRRTGGIVLDLYRNYRSTDEVCEAVETVFGPSGSMPMMATEEQTEFSGMVSNRGPGITPAVIHHVITTEAPDAKPDFNDAAICIAKFIRARVREGRNQFGDFLLLSWNKETHYEYTDVFRYYHIPIIFDGKLSMGEYQPVQLLNLRVQSVCHPFDESLAFRVLYECFGVTPQEWDLFRMNLKELPREALGREDPVIHTAVFRSKQLRDLLPHTDMNLKILDALQTMERDVRLSRSRTPCAFLRELTEKSEGLFMEEYEAGEYQNQYAALLHVIDSIGSQHPAHFSDMADILKSYAEGEMAHMPSVRADDNYVRLMNLHKVKGLESKIVIFLPCKASSFPPDNHVEREGIENRGWMIIKDSKDYKSPQYKPPGWSEQAEKEKALLDAENLRKRYVALTRAKDEIHFFDFPADASPWGGKAKNAWTGFECIGDTVVSDPVEEDTLPYEDSTDDPVAERESLLAVRQAVNLKHSVRVTPSSLEENIDLPGDDPDEPEDDDATIEEEEDAEGPGGKDWGTAVHRAAELIITEGSWSEDSIAKAADMAVKETFRTEILSDSARRNLQIPEGAKTLTDIQGYLTENAVKAFKFMSDESSDFRKIVAGAVTYAEMPFVISVTETDNKEAFFRLKAVANSTSADETRLNISGKIDLALHYPDHTWKILDYKTDRMRPQDKDVTDFVARLYGRYGNQLEIYKIVLELITGETVTDTVLISV